MTLHDYGLVCPKNTFVYRDGVCDGPQFAKCVACAADQYGAIRSAALTTGLAVTRRSWRRVDRYIAVSNPVARACSSLAADGERPIAVIPPFLPDESFHPIDSTRPAFIPIAGDYIMFAGALGPHKGINVLLEAYAKLDPATPLVLVGLRRHDTPQRFPQGVIVVEDVPHADVMRAWTNCAVAVVPSCWPEPFGLTALEAMAVGRPVVASAVGGLSDLVLDGVSGILVPPGAATELGAMIGTLLKDPRRRAQMGRAGRERAFTYSASVVVPQLERVYQEVIANPPEPVNVRGHSLSR